MFTTLRTPRVQLAVAKALQQLQAKEAATSALDTSDTSSAQAHMAVLDKSINACALAVQQAEEAVAQGMPRVAWWGGSYCIL